MYGMTREEGMMSDKWLTVGDLYPRANYESEAYKRANSRELVWQRPALYMTEHGLLLLEWGRYGWNCRWLDEPETLSLPRIAAASTRKET